MRVTIGLPCRDAEDYLGFCLNSILNQSHEDWRLIAIDDGSTDQTLSILKSGRDKRIQVISDGERRGLACRLNQLTALTETGLYFRMDADDIMFPSRLQTQVAHMRRHPECDLLGSGIVSIDAGNLPLGLRRAPSRVSDPAWVFERQVLFHPTLCGRTEWFRANPYDESLEVSQDYELWARTAGKAVIHNIAEPLLFYREDDTSPYSKYRRQSRVTKDCLRACGRKVLGFRRCLLASLKRRGKDLAYGALHHLGLWHRALDARNTPLGEDAARCRDLLDEAIKEQVTEGADHR